MGAKKPRIVIIGAGMAGLAAANKLCTAARDDFEVLVVEAGARIGGRINTSEFCRDRIELGATWIHGVEGSPVYEIATRIGALCSDQPWECMDGSPDAPRTVAEDGSEVSPTVLEPISSLFDSLMDFAQGETSRDEETEEFHGIAAEALEACGLGTSPSVGSFLRKGFEIYRGRNRRCESSDPRRDFDEEAVFAMYENIQRTYTSAGNLSILDFHAESEYVMCAGEEITIAKGYSSIIQSLAAILPPGTIQLGREVVEIEWRPPTEVSENGHSDSRPVTVRFRDGSAVAANHVVVTVSLGVLKARTKGPDSSLFIPPLPAFKTDAISRLGFGTVNKVFLQLAPNADHPEFPVLQMAFHRPGSVFRNEAVPWWMRRTASLGPIHRKSDVLLSWFAGEEALHLETLTDEEILEGVSSAVDPMLRCEARAGARARFVKVLRSKWGSDPLFMGSYSYVAVGVSGDELDAMAEPLPEAAGGWPLQVMFAGEATHRTHYSTTHGAYFSGIREALRLLKHYNKCS